MVEVRNQNVFTVSCSNPSMKSTWPFLILQQRMKYPLQEMKSRKPFHALNLTRPRAQMELTLSTSFTLALWGATSSPTSSMPVTTGHITTVFQLGYITPIPKDPKKDQTGPSNYCGISLLSLITSNSSRKSSLPNSNPQPSP